MTDNLVTRLRGWLDEDVPIGVIMNEAADRIAQLEGQHKGLALQNALLRQRPDLPVDRIPAAAEVRND